MPRPKKYHTAEERRAAKAASMRRSHHARQRRRADRKERASTRMDGPDNGRGNLVSCDPGKERKTQVQLQETQHVETIRSNLAKVNTIRTSMKHTLQGSAKSYLDGRCSWFEVDLNDPQPNMSINVIETHLKRWNEFLTRLQPCMDAIYELAGYGEEYKSANVLKREIQVMVQWLEDIICTALVNPLDVVCAYKKGELALPGRNERQWEYVDYSSPWYTGSWTMCLRNSVRIQNMSRSLRFVTCRPESIAPIVASTHSPHECPVVWTAVSVSDRTSQGPSPALIE
ncbi:hypothetical protein FA13DRAFT_1708038 [Coprinellus micaceus]|uniref:Uncharacterized protein n=1 Tax=Coprinellus micaceus TaxID=71717 RepID=A0A4Y7TJW8_COPMI|nr:hypothetical protein FA13DRAFT_1708038 [Coprinellus micaceus]